MVNRCVNCRGAGCVYCKWNAHSIDINELVELHRPHWDDILLNLQLSGTLLNAAGNGGSGSGAGGASGEGGDQGGSSGSGSGSSDDSDDDNDDDDDDDDEVVTPTADDVDAWKRYARQWEKRAKTHRKESRGARRATKRAETAEARIRELEQGNQSETDRKIAEAREDAEKTVSQKYEAERRTDRLENSTIKLATKGIKVKLDGEEQVVKFADPEDAMAHLERAAKRGDVDMDDLFDDTGKVNRDELTEALKELLEDKPHLRAADAGSGSAGNGGSGRGSSGSADFGRGGRDSGGKDYASMSAEEHLSRIQTKK